MKDPIVNIAVKAARIAGNIIMKGLDRLDSISVVEKDKHDYVTEIDKQAEQEIIKVIRKAHPSHGILSEESGEMPGDEFTWVIDPLDGTRNFIHGYPHFAVSIAVLHKGKMQHGVIYDPIRQDLFTATRGKGAQLNERRIRVSKRSTMEECLLATGFPRRLDEKGLKAYANAIQTIIPVCGDMRRSGSAALDLANIAAGRLDGFWEANLKIWDIAAAALMIKEAGGMVIDFDGGEDYLKSGNIIAGNPKVLKWILQKVAPFFKC